MEWMELISVSLEEGEAAVLVARWQEGDKTLTRAMKEGFLVDVEGQLTLS